MITFSKVNSFFKEKGRLVLKVVQYGVTTAKQTSSFGDDSCPIQGMTAIYAETKRNGNDIIIGYINTNSLAEAGEKRLYSLKSDGSQSNYIWLKNDETIEIGGNDDNFVKNKAMESLLAKLKRDINLELDEIQKGIISAKGTYNPTHIQIDSSDLKTEKIKTKS